MIDLLEAMSGMASTANIDPGLENYFVRGGTFVAIGISSYHMRSATHALRRDWMQLAGAGTASAAAVGHWFRPQAVLI